MTDKATDIEMLTDLIKKERVPLEHFKHRERIKSAITIGTYNGGNAGARAAFYDERHRQKPSLPKLKFLEGGE